MLKKLLCTVFAAVLAACGGSETSAGDDVGSLSLAVLASGSGDLAPEKLVRIDVQLSGPEEVAITTLERGEDGTFSHTFMGLTTGDYTIVAEGLDSDGRRIFLSSAESMTVRKDAEASVIIVLHEVDSSSTKIEAPSFLSLAVSDTMPGQGDTITITGRALNATGVWGYHPEGSPAPGVFSNYRENDAKLDKITGEFQLTWTAPNTAGKNSFFVAIGDKLGNESAMIVTVWVGSDHGDGRLDFSFNRAPTAHVQSVVVNDREAASYRLWMLVNDDEPGSIAYTWYSDCASLKSSYAGLSGNVVIDDPNTSAGVLFFEFEVPYSSRTGEADTCGLRLKLSEVDPTAGVTVESIYTLELNSRLIGPDAGLEEVLDEGGEI